MKPLLVCGLGRCGTSLVIGMLDRGGHPVFGEAPAYEPNELMRPLIVADLWPLIEGRAAKILDPQLAEWPAGILEATVIWLDRDPKEQAKSIVKMIEISDSFRLPGGTWRRLVPGIKADRRKALDILDEHIAGDFHLFHFEYILANPELQAARLAEAAGITDPERIRAMAGFVQRRSSKCAKGLEIELAGVTAAIRG